MDFSSWFRRSLLKSSENPEIQNQSTKSNQHQEEEEFLGVTDQLIDHLKSFTLDTFKNFPFKDDNEGAYDVEAPTTSSGKVRKDLSEWQERHAFLVLSKSKELSQLRFRLCPAHLKEPQFWSIYFLLVHSYLADYELHAIQQAKIKSMATENEQKPDTSAYEVEMAETKQAASLSPSMP